MAFGLGARPGLALTSLERSTSSGLRLDSQTFGKRMSGGSRKSSSSERTGGAFSGRENLPNLRRMGSGVRREAQAVRS